MSDIEVRARELLASCLNEWGHHQEASNVRDGDDLESYEFELRVIGQLLRFGFDTGYGHATRAPQWQPIESAPKDSVTAFLGWDGDDMFVTYWCEWPRFRGWYKGEDQYETFLWEPTHWMPLPARPEVEA